MAKDACRVTKSQGTWKTSRACRKTGAAAWEASAVVRETGMTAREASAASRGAVVARGLGSRVLSVAMTLVLAVGLMPLPAFATEGGGDASGLAAGLAAGGLSAQGALGDGSGEGLQAQAGGLSAGAGGLSAQGASVSGPRVVSDSSMTSGQRVTWDCVWFGSYPQGEVTLSDSVYASLLNASWDTNGDATVGGAKHRRIAKSDTTNSDYFSSATYHYFKCEPVKWRVIL